MASDSRFFRFVLHITLVLNFVLPRSVSGQPAAFVADRPAAEWLYDYWKIEVSPTRGIILDIDRKARVNALQGRAVGRLKIWETFYQSLQKFSGTLSDTLGGILFQIEKADLKSGFPFSDYRLYSEDRLYEVDLAAPSFPYFVEYHYQVLIDNTFFWPDWVFLDEYPRDSVSYTVAVPHRFAYRTREVWPGLRVDTDRSLKRDITVWSAVDVLPETVAGSAPLPVMYIAPENFVVARQRGSTESWASLGSWYDKLTEGRRKITKQQAREIKALPTNPADPYTVVLELKDFVSHNWRYVAIEVGIGGWRPHEAASVFDSKYGDCKDLTYLWLAMLDQFGIEAHPALLRTRLRQPIMADFPKDWFDHVVGCAVIGADTIWADLTAPGYRAGTLPYQAEGRHALVITKNGGVLCRTPGSRPADNVVIRSLTGNLQRNGDLAFSLRAEVTGHKLRVLGTGTSTNNDDRRAAEVLGVLPGRLTAEAMSFAANPDGISAGVQVTGIIAEWAEFTGQRIVFPLTFAGWAAPQPMVEPGDGYSATRRPYPCREIDSLLIILPSGYACEFMPADVVVDEGPVHFAFSSRFAGDTLIYCRDFQYAAGRDQAETPDLDGHSIAAIQNADAVFVRVAEPAGDSATSTF